MDLNKNQNNKFISLWLLLITFLVALIIIVGGLTRLTDSGLSITKWDLFTGIFPPISLDDWEKSFSLYKKIPEYKLINSSMTLDQFKIIYWWEYAHRLLGRAIVLLFILPLIYLTFKRKLSKKNIFSFYFILFLMLFQGFVGWYMVKSGLVDRTDVSQYRLSLHLTLAIIIFCILFWNFLKNVSQSNFESKIKISFYLPIIFLIILILQISLGAFVSGLDAGQIYQSWPLMNQSYFPDDSMFTDLFSLKVFETPSLAQFIHRNVAYIMLVFFLVILFIVFKNDDLTYLRKSTILVFLFLLLQFFLGILTIIFGAQIFFASMHQLCSIVLLAATLILVFKNSRIN
jgi:cytochrome c oxidase assembly protein subunit 15|tara:strand:+ start:270 stop:1301 length:1032 start_codon:yes stop_codon:yes gene_type:complete